MISPGQLFAKRLGAQLRFQFGIWRTVVDWTVALYLVLPALALGIHQYLLWWKDTPPWVHVLPADLLFAGCFLFAWSGTIRVFLREGDQLFLLAQKHWLKKIMEYGLIYSVALYLVSSAFFLLLLAPFLLRAYEFTQTRLFFLFVLIFLSKIFLGLVKQLLSLRFQGWRQFVALRGTMVLGSLFFIALIPKILPGSKLYSAAMLLLLIAVGLLGMKRLHYKGGFFADVAREQRERLKYVDFLLSFSGVRVKRTSRQRKRPWLFARSNLIFKKRNAVNGLVEAGIKSTLRNSRRLGQYLQFLGLCLLIILGVPERIKWPVWLVLGFIFAGFVGLYWQENLSSEFIRLFAWKPEDKHLALRKFLFIVTLPGFLLISLPVGFQAFSWTGALLMSPVSIGAIFYICKIVAFYIDVTTKERR